MVALIAAALLSLTACTQSADNTETITCNGECVIVFRPDTTNLDRYLQGDDKMEFLEVLSDYQHYADALKEKLSKANVNFSESDARFIIVNNGTSETKLDTKHNDYLFGVILVKPNAQPEMHHGIFTDMEYQLFMDQYFGTKN